MKKTIFIFLSLVLISSCDLEQTVDTELDYKEQMVVQAVLEEGKWLENIFITRTLPPLYDGWDESDAFISDVDASIWVNGTEYELIQDANRFYNSQNMTLKAGDILRLEAKWKGMTLRGETYIPPKPEVDYLSGYIDSVTYEWGYTERNYVLFAVLKNRPQNTYYTGGERNVTRYNYDQSVSGPGRILTNKVVLLNEQRYYSEPNDPWGEEQIDSIQQIEGSFYIDAHTADFPLYWDSRENGSSNNDGPFSVGGLNPIWNVEGGIGVFFGRNRFVFNSRDYTIVTEESN